MEINSYEQAVKYLESFIGKIRFEITPEFLKRHDPLERMRVLLSLLDNPQDKFPSILIGGTSGKGSTAYLISHILTTAGYRTGLTISPHLQKLNERLQVNNQSIPDEGFLKLLNTSIPSSIKEMSEMGVGAPSYFEILIAMAFLYFCQEKVDIAVVEVGMGGEYDATNTLYPLIAVLTNVSLDHTNVLGGTVQKIARTKAGIIKGLRMKDKGLRINNWQSKIHNSSFINNPLVVTGVKQPSVIKIVESRCKEVGAELYRSGKDFEYRVKKENIGGSVFDLTTTHDRGLQLNDLNLSLLGRHQVENASLAIETILQLKNFGFKVSEHSIRMALKTAFFAGRFEILRLTSFAQDKTSRTLVLDGAHNPVKMRAFLTTLKDLFPKQRKIFVVGFKLDKDVKKMLRQILQVADKIIITEFHGKTDTNLNASADALNIKYQISNIKKDMKVTVEKDSKKALQKALNVLISQYPNIYPLIIVTGSLYLVGEVRNML